MYLIITELFSWPTHVEDFDSGHDLKLFISKQIPQTLV